MNVSPNLKLQLKLQLKPQLTPQLKPDLKLLSGRAALDCVESEQFRSRWMALYARCPWATGCQHPDFVVPWYRLYQEQFLPVVLLQESGEGSESGAGELAGLLTLALRRQGTTLTGAGAHQAEYQAWLAPADAGNAFIVAAVHTLRTAFPGIALGLRYLPPRIPLDWLEGQDYRKLCSVRSHARPLMHIDEAAMARQRNKKNHRQNHNRLKRMGEVRFERIVDHERFAEIFDEVCMQYDFRQAALFHQMPFAGDPMKKPFYFEMHRRGLLHVTVLTVGRDIAACHIGLLSGLPSGPLGEQRALHLGIMTHAPAYAAHSPGSLLLAMLGVQLAQENLPLFDLTPGGDGYKEHFATGHDTVSELSIHGDARRRLQAEALGNLKRLSKQGLRKVGCRPADILTALERVGGALRSPGAGSWRAWLGRRHPQGSIRPCSLRYRCQPGADAGTGGGLAIAVNRLQDVFRFDPDASSLTHWEFFDIVMKRMERSSHLYSLVLDERLVLFCWAKAGAADPASPEDAIVLSDLYVHRQFGTDALVRRFIGQVLCDIRASRPQATVYYRGDLDARLRTVVEQCGFVDESP